MKFVFLFFALKPEGKFNNTVGVDKPSQVPRPTWEVGRENEPPESGEYYFRGV